MFFIRDELRDASNSAIQRQVTKKISLTNTEALPCIDICNSRAFEKPYFRETVFSKYSVDGRDKLCTPVIASRPFFIPIMQFQLNRAWFLVVSEE